MNPYNSGYQPGYGGYYGNTAQNNSNYNNMMPAANDMTQPNSGYTGNTSTPQVNTSYQQMNNEQQWNYQQEWTNPQQLNHQQWNNQQQMNNQQEWNNSQQMNFQPQLSNQQQLNPQDWNNQKQCNNQPNMNTNVSNPQQWNIPQKWNNPQHWNNPQQWNNKQSFNQQPMNNQHQWRNQQQNQQLSKNKQNHPQSANNWHSANSQKSAKKQQSVIDQQGANDRLQAKDQPQFNNKPHCSNQPYSDIKNTDSSAPEKLPYSKCNDKRETSIKRPHSAVSDNYQKDEEPNWKKNKFQKLKHKHKPVKKQPQGTKNIGRVHGTAFYYCQQLFKRRDRHVMGDGKVMPFKRMCGHLKFKENIEHSKEIWEYFETNRQADEAYMAKVKLRDALYVVFKDVFTYCGLYMVGSSMSGFATKSSDLDLCLMLSKEPDIENESLNILQAFQSCLDKCEFMDRSKLIQTKQGHILKFKDNQGHIPCYLHINNAVGIRNTHLLRYYAIMDWRVRPLIAYLKMWARFHDINDPSNQTISSYSLSLMMIHYLQYFTRPPVLPSIQKMYPELFEVDIENLKMDAEVKYDTKNTQSLGDLFMGFLEYYAVQFDYDKDVASVRLASKLSVDVVVSMVPKNEPNKWTYLKIEEPFDRRNTAYACYNFKAFARIKRVFVNSYIQLRETKKLSSIFEKKIDSSVGWRSELKKPNAEGKSQNKHA